MGSAGQENVYSHGPKVFHEQFRLHRSMKPFRFISAFIFYNEVCLGGSHCYSTHGKPLLWALRDMQIINHVRLSLSITGCNLIYFCSPLQLSHNVSEDSSFGSYNMGQTYIFHTMKMLNKSIHVLYLHWGRVWYLFPTSSHSHQTNLKSCQKSSSCMLCSKKSNCISNSHMMRHNPATSPSRDGSCHCSYDKVPTQKQYSSTLTVYNCPT
jgi:hypothetical protein